LHQTVKELTAAIASGNDEALAVLYRGWFDWLYREARRVSRCDESFCLDVVQDVMMRLVRTIKPMETEANLRAWLSTVLRCCILDRLRGERRREARHRRLTLSRPAEECPAELSDRLEWLRNELAGLEDSQMRLIVLRYQLGWTLRDIGDALGLAAGAVDGRIRRILAGLRKRALERRDA